MKIKLIKGTDLNKLEIMVNLFIDEVKVIDIKLYHHNQSHICLIQYYDMV